jgi:hypothetical protein
MQKLFQTNNFNESNSFDFGPSPVTSPPPQFLQPSQTPINSQFPMNQNADSSFNTLQQLFTTTNYSNLNANQPSSTVPPQKSNPYDMFSTNKPATFSTISGLQNNQGLDLSNFGTLQFNAPQPTQSDDFLKPAFKKPVASTDLI